MRVQVFGNHGNFDLGYSRWIETHVRTALARRASQVERVEIHLSACAGGGRDDKRCVLRLVFEHGIETVVQETGGDARAMLESAIRRCHRVLWRLALRTLRSRATPRRRSASA